MSSFPSVELFTDLILQVHNISWSETLGVLLCTYTLDGGHDCVNLLLWQTNEMITIIKTRKRTNIITPTPIDAISKTVRWLSLDSAEVLVSGELGLGEFESGEFGLGELGSGEFAVLRSGELAVSASGVPGCGELAVSMSGEPVMPGSGELAVPMSVVSGSVEIVVTVSGEPVVPGSGEIVVTVSGEPVVPGSGEIVVTVSGEPVVPGSGEIVVTVSGGLEELSVGGKACCVASG